MNEEARDKYEKYFGSTYFVLESYRNGRSATEMEKEILENIPEEDCFYPGWHSILSDIFHELHDACAANKIPIFLMGGSCIGAIRHHRIIPWDTDGDVGIFEKDLPRLKAALEGTNITLHEGVCKERLLYSIRSKAKSCPAIDVFVWNRKNGSSEQQLWEERASIKRSIIEELTLIAAPTREEEISCFEEHLENYNDEDGEYMIWSPKIYTPKEGIRVVKSNVMLPFMEMEFCGDTWTIPAYCEEYLATEGYKEVWAFPKLITKIVPPAIESRAVKSYKEYMDGKQTDSSDIWNI